VGLGQAGGLGVERLGSGVLPDAEGVIGLARQQLDAALGLARERP
jgi:hypothetical protein